ncbi:hypothetical protein QE436_004429 [Pantoea anthophila]|nr:hypothetical protein [Pantoea anthophila]
MFTEINSVGLRLIFYDLLIIRIEFLSDDK